VQGGWALMVFPAAFLTTMLVVPPAGDDVGSKVLVDPHCRD